jgi:N-acetylneuraminic acid mutarotase
VGGRVNAMVARLPDGRVLVAGGDLFVQSGPDVSRSAALYNPGTNRWSVLPPLPGPRAGGAAVALQDGSVLLVGGYSDQTSAWAACNEPQGLASTLRFVPSP